MKHKSNNHTPSGGMGILGVLQMIFIVLKCLGLIDWSWAVVFIPTWINLGIIVLAVIIMVGITAYDTYKYK